MPLDVIPDSAPYPRAALGWDGIDYRVLAVNAAGELVFPGGMIPFNYDRIHHSTTVNFAAGAGVNVLPAPPIAGTEIVVVSSLSAFNITSAVTSIAVGKTVGGQVYVAGYLDTPAIREPAIFNGAMVLAVGEQAWSEFRGCVAGDTIYLHVTGYYMVI